MAAGDANPLSEVVGEEGTPYRNRFVRTPKYRAETAAGQIKKRSFGHNAPGGILANIGRPPANAANTSFVVVNRNNLLKSAIF